jgi:hypothetical protein
MDKKEENRNVIPASVNSKELYESWMKIELVATHKTQVGKRVGTILLGYALITAIKVRNFIIFS